MKLPDDTDSTDEAKQERTWMRFFVTFLIYCLIWGFFLSGITILGREVMNPEQVSFYFILLLPPASAAGLRVLVS